MPLGSTRRRAATTRPTATNVKSAIGYEPNAWLAVSIRSMNAAWVSPSSGDELRNTGSPTTSTSAIAPISTSNAVGATTDHDGTATLRRAVSVSPPASVARCVTSQSAHTPRSTDESALPVVPVRTAVPQLSMNCVCPIAASVEKAITP